MADYVSSGGSGSSSSRKKKAAATAKKKAALELSSSSLYGGGKYDSSYNDYENESSEMVDRSTSGGGGSDSTAFIKATFAARRLKVQSMMKSSNGDASNDADDISSLVYNGRVIKPQFTASKIIDLTNASRELYVRKILHELVENKKIVENVTGFDEGTAADSLMNIAANMEYEIFSTKRTISTYRTGCVKLVRDIRVATSCRKVYDCSMNESYCYNNTSPPQVSSSRSAARKRTTASKTGRKTTRRKRKSLGRGKSTSKSPKKTKRTTKKYTSSSNSSFALSSPTATKSSENWLQAGSKTLGSDWKKRKPNYSDDDDYNNDGGEDRTKPTPDPVIVLDMSDDEHEDFVPKRNSFHHQNKASVSVTNSSNNSVVNLVTSSACSSASNSRSENDAHWNAIETPPAPKTNFSFKQSAISSPPSSSTSASKIGSHVYGYSSKTTSTITSSSNSSSKLPKNRNDSLSDTSAAPFATPTNESMQAARRDSSSSLAAMATPTFRSSALLLSEQLTKDEVTPQFEKKPTSGLSNGLASGASGASAASAADTSTSTLSKQQLGTMIVKVLTPAYCEGRFTDREHFKDTARRIANAVLVMKISDSSKIKTFTEDYVQKHL